MDSEVDRQEEHTSISNKRSADDENPLPSELKRRRRDSETRNGGPSRTRFTVEDYTVGWLCALPIEMAAAKSMLDDVHDNLAKSLNDSNTYIFGSLKHHNVVIACLPTDGYGTNNAAIVASHMRRTFPSLQIFLMVGIGGGAPGKVDIRLGDVVVSTHVIQYDLGKTIHQGRFQPTSIPRQPSQALMTAVSTLRAYHESESSKIPAILSQMRERYPSMTQYSCCEPLQDLLFDSTYDHTRSIESCDDCDKSRLVDRSFRSNNNPTIHYGVIASGNRVIKHAKTRDQLAQEFNALCFEMEAAGLMDSLQCLVVRGICDYSDSHKNKQWQKYASATAAAYTKELLSVIPAIGTQAPPTRKIVRDHRKLLMDMLSFEKIDARHSNIKPAYGKTCAWLLSHPEYIGWLTPTEFSQHRGFLWIHGKPGAGKSTLMKYIYTRALASSDTTISFFFNARGDDLEKSTEGMYRSLLLQLLEKLPDLQEGLDYPRRFCQDQNDHYTWDIEVLQSLFSAAMVKLGQRRVTCFVDALDECGESEVRDMVEYFEQLGQSALANERKLYICFSSRHYPTICIQNGQQLILENQLGHSQDLEKYVRGKLRAGKGKDVEQIRKQLLQKASGVFMWAVLVVNILNEEFERGRIFAVRKRLQETPAELSELFKDILRRDNKNMADLLLCIQWILYAKRPMRPEEFYYALVAGLDPGQENLAEWDPEIITTDDMNRFVSSSSKGLAEVTKSKARTVQFIHESVRDFLLKDGGINDLWPNLEADFQSRSHDQLKQCCYTYLQTDISSHIAFDQELPKASYDTAKALRQQVSGKFPFLEYATHQVLYHANIAAVELPQHDFLKSFDLGAWINLDNLFAKFETRRHTSSASLPYILAENNFARLINSGFSYDTKVHNHGERHGYPLFAAFVNGNREAVKALLRLEDGLINPDHITAQLSYGRSFKARRGQTPLSWAILYEHKEIVLTMIKQGADFKFKDNYGQTPLMWATRNGHKEIVQLLVKNGADFEVKNSRNRILLLWAATNGYIKMLQMLVEKDEDANVELNDNNGWSLLSRAAICGHNEILQLLAENGADFEAKDCQNDLLLSWAAANGYEEIVQILVKKDVNIESKDNDGRTPLSWATQYGHTNIVQVLVKQGADVESKDNNGRTSLSWATQYGNTKTAQLLVEKDADIESQDNDNWTPLLRATLNGYKDIVQLLVEKGADFEKEKSRNQIMRWWAAEKNIGPVQDYQLQLRLLEYQNKKRLIEARREQDS